MINRQRYQHLLFLLLFTFSLYPLHSQTANSQSNLKTMLQNLKELNNLQAQFTLEESDNSTEWKSFNISTSTGPLENLLSSITLHLPPVPVSVPSLGLDMLLTNLTCFNLAADNVLGSYFFNNSLISHPLNQSVEYSSNGEYLPMQGLYMNLTITNISLNCTSDFFYTLAGGNDTGYLLFLLSNSELAFDFRLYQLPPSNDSTSPPSLFFSPSKRTLSSSSLFSSLSLDRLHFGEQPHQILADEILPMPSPSSSSSRVGESVRVEWNSEKVTNDVSRQVIRSLLEEPISHHISFIKQAEGNGVIESARVFNGSVNSCGMEAVVSYFNSTSSFLNRNSRVVSNIIETTVPEVVCAQLDVLISSNITSILNNVSFALYNVTETFYNYQYPIPLDERGAILGLLFCTLLAILFVGYYAGTEIYWKLQARKHINQYDDDGNEEGRGERHPLRGEKMAGKKDSEVFSMMRSPQVHWAFRYGILLFFLYNIALFISATISVAASVYIYLTLPFIRYQTPSLYSFTLVSSVVEMWEAGIWPLALLIGGASGVWPYVKIILLIFCWTVPPTLMGGKMRGVVIIILDALGKWSLIDAYVLVLFLESFRVHFDLLGEAIAFDMVVIPQYAFYSYLLGLMGSLSISHVVLYFHKKIEEPPIPITVRESLFNHTFKIKQTLPSPSVDHPSDHLSDHSDDALKYSNRDHYPSSPVHSSSSSIISSRKSVDTFVASLTTTGKVSIIFVLLFTIIISVIGYFINAFEFSYDNSLVGFLLKPLGENIKHYSIASLTWDLPYATLNDPGDVGVRVIQFTFLMFSFAIPMLFLLSLIVLWVVPMTSREQHNYFVAVEIVSAWAAVDVFIVAVFVSLLELEQFAIFVVGDRCDGLDSLLALLPPTPEDFTCFTVKATLSSGSWILLFAVIVLDIVGYSIMIFCRRAIYERMHREIDRQSRANLLAISSDDNHLDLDSKSKLTPDDYSGGENNNPTTISLTYSLTSTLDSIQKSPFYVRFCHSLSCIKVHHLSD